MGICDRCINKGNCGAQEFFEEGKLLLSHCRNFVGEKPREIKTNFQRITASPEALAKWLCEITDFCDRGCSHCPIQKECRYDADGAGNRENEEMLLEWLKQESK